MALLSALLCGLASPTFIGCKDYDDDIKDLQEQITANKTSIDELLGKIKEGQFVQSVEKIANGLKVTLGDGSVVEIVNGKDGCLLYTSPSPRDSTSSRMPSSA